MLNSTSVRCKFVYSVSFLSGASAHVTYLATKAIEFVIAALKVITAETFVSSVEKPSHLGNALGADLEISLKKGELLGNAALLFWYLRDCLAANAAAGCLSPPYQISPAVW